MKESVLHGKSILVVHDERDVFMVFEEEVREAGSSCSIEKAMTFEDASQKLASYTYDLII